MMIQKQRPCDLDMEFGLIGWILANNKVMSVIGDLRADDFYSSAHADIFQAIEKLNRKGDGITPFTIAPLLENPELFEDFGGVNKYLAGSFSHSLAFPMPYLLGPHLVKLANERRFSEACEKAVDMPVAEAAALVTRAATEATSSKDRLSLKDSKSVSVDICEDMKSDVVPYSTGLKKLNEAMGGGIYTGKSYGFAARKKVGKTSLAATISHNLNVAGVRHLFICGEMSAKEIHQRVLARVTNSFTGAFRSDYGDSAAFRTKIAKATLEMPKNTLYSDSAGITFDELKAIVTLAHEQHQIKGFILDYWQLVGGKAKNQSTAEHLDEVAQWIADISRKMGIWSITFAQINQEGNTRGGEGIRLAFDQLYELKREDLSQPFASLEMMETRYTQWMNIENLVMREHGQWFDEA